MLSDVRETVPSFVQSSGYLPIGFIAFDLDYHTSTRDAFRILAGPDKSCLPRVLPYFDDIIIGDQQYYCEDLGELLAIREFNENPPRNPRIRTINGWRRNHVIEPHWNDAMLVHHRFDHARYDDFIGE